MLTLLDAGWRGPIDGLGGSKVTLDRGSMKMSAKPGSNEFEPADEYEPFLRTGEDTLQAVAAGTRLHLCSFPEQTKEEHQCCGQAVKKMLMTTGLWSGQKISGDDHKRGKAKFSFADG